MQGLADGYFVLPNTINDYLAAGPFPKVDATHPAAVEAVEAVRSRIDTLLSIERQPHRRLLPPELGRVMWDYCGMERSEEGLRKAHRPDPRAEGGVLVRRQGAGHQRRSSTRRWSGPVGWRTSSSSAS